MKIIKDQPPMHLDVYPQGFLQFKCICVLPLTSRRGSVTEIKMMRAGGCYMVIIIVMPLSTDVIYVADNRIENLFQRKTQK